jgi:hypothetical protein
VTADKNQPVQDASGKDYPTWICIQCGIEHGRNSVNGFATYHMGKCDICGRDGVPVTEPRDYGHLNPEWQCKKKQEGK